MHNRTILVGTLASERQAQKEEETEEAGQDTFELSDPGRASQLVQAPMRDRAS